MSWWNIANSVLGAGHNRSIATPTFSNSLTTTTVDTPTIPQASATTYAGGSLPVTIKRNDTQETFARRGLHDHAIQAGLGEAEANEFAAKWTNKQTTLKHYENGNSVSYTPAEFAALKTKGTAPFTLNQELDAEILADLNERVAYNEQFKAESVPAYTPEERAALEREKNGVGQDKAALQNKPVVAMIDAQTKDGKPLTEDLALSRYIERTYNKDGRVWGDKINEMVNLAKTNGVKVENLQISEDGQTATFGISEADKQKLDGLFAEAVSETQKGVQAGRDAAADTSNSIQEFYEIQANGAINVVNDASKIIGAPAIPKFEITGSWWQKNGRKEVGEITSTIGASVVTGNVGAVGRAANIADAAVSSSEAIVGQDMRTGEQLSTTQRVIQGVGAGISTPSASKDALNAAETAFRKGSDLSQEVAERMRHANLRFPAGGFVPKLATANAAPITNAPVEKLLHSAEDLNLLSKKAGDLEMLSSGGKAEREEIARTAEDGLNEKAQSGVKQIKQELGGKEAVKQAANDIKTLSVARAELMVRLERLPNEVELMSDTQQLVRRAQNSLLNNLKDDDLSGALRDIHGKPVRVSGSGEAFDHLQEVRQGYNSLDRTKGLLIREMRNKPVGSDEYKRLSNEVDAISEMMRKLKEFLGDDLTA